MHLGLPFAAVIALVNDALIAAGKPALGILDPWIYGGAFAALTDINTGSSIGCDTAGFPGAFGWDAVTGFGAQVFKDVLNIALIPTDDPTESAQAHRRGIPRTQSMMPVCLGRVLHDVLKRQRGYHL